MTKEHANFVADVIAFMQVAGIRVKGQRVAIIRDPSKEKVGSIFLAEEAQRKEPRGTIVALGRTLTEEDDVAVGDRVMYTKYSPIHFTLNMPGDRKADIELFHVSDIYLQWEGDDVA